MKRVIKFRLWQTIWTDKDLVKMWTVESIDFKNKVYFVEGSCAGYYFKDAILMQNIELQDKIGHFIYEGDIVQYDFDKLLYVVEYHNGAFVLRRNVSNIKRIDFTECDYGKEIEIVGNIHENTNLLTEVY